MTVCGIMSLSTVFLAFCATSLLLLLPVECLRAIKSHTLLSRVCVHVNKSPLSSTLKASRSYGIANNVKTDGNVYSSSSSNSNLDYNTQKTKMGRPKRRVNNEEEYASAGRVAVYCIGAGLDIPALRTHIFRRGFGNQKSPEAVAAGERPELVLARSPNGASKDDYGDEVLHVSNAPLFISYDKKRAPSSNGMGVEIVAPSSPVPMDENLAISEPMEDDGEAWEARERLLMATQDIFYFDYGCVIFWGLTPAEERAAIDELAGFTIDAVSGNELDNSYDSMEFVFDRKANPQRPIKFDRMRLRTLQVEEKLALSYAMAQSSKLFVFESKVLDSVEMTRYLPKELARDGKIQSSKKELNQLIGQLFVQQTEVNLFSSILDTPDFLWDDDEHLPVYHYTRSYFEVDDRVSLLNSRLAVIRELLDVLNAQVANSNSTRLEWIIIWLISVEIIMGILSNSYLKLTNKVFASFLVPVAVSMFAYTRSSTKANKKLGLRR